VAIPEKFAGLVSLSTSIDAYPEADPKRTFPDRITRSFFLSGAGGLISYGVNLPDNFRRAAIYVVKILNGTRPGELPVEFSNKLELIINLNTAKELGLDIPAALLARADEVIE
jgi:hypothetical protein